MRQIDGVEIAPWERAILRADMGRSIVTSGDFVARVKVREAIELPFVVVSVVGLLDGGSHPLGGRGSFFGRGVLVNWFKWRF